MKLKEKLTIYGAAFIMIVCSIFIVTVAAKSFEYNPVPIFNNSPARALNTPFQSPALRGTMCNYTVTVVQALSLLNSSVDGRIYFEISPDNVNWTQINGAGSTKTLAVSITVGLNETLIYNISGAIPKGYYARLRTALAGGATASMTSGQEVLF